MSNTAILGRGAWLTLAPSALGARWERGVSSWGFRFLPFAAGVLAAALHVEKRSTAVTSSAVTRRHHSKFTTPNAFCEACGEGTGAFLHMSSLSDGLHEGFELSFPPKKEDST